MKALPLILKYNKVEQRLFYLLIIALLLFGTTFSKFNIVGPLYLHDIILGLLTLYSFNKIPLKIKFGSIIVLFFLAFLYLLYSLLFFNLTFQLNLIAIRHFAIFLYLFCCYYIIVYKTDIYNNITFLIWVSRLSIIIQLVYFILGLLFIPDYSLFEGYPYYSPLSIMGVITYAGYTLAYPVNYKWIKFIGVLLISTMLGHSSAFLAVAFTGFTYLLLRINVFQKWAFIFFGILIIFLLTFLPQFNDANASWRILYWQHILHQAIDTTKFGVIGHGFGKPFMTYDFSEYIMNEIGSTNMYKKELARWLSPPHNSFLTLVFHVGLIPSLLVLAPIRKKLFQLVGPTIGDRNNQFLVCALIGNSVWVAFNVILELPHSSIFYWLIFFTAALYTKKANA